MRMIELCPVNRLAKFILVAVSKGHLTKISIGSIKHPKVRQILNSHTQVGLRPILPNISQRPAICTIDLDRIHKVDRLEPSRQHDQVIFLFAFAFNFNSLLRNTGNGTRFQIDVIASESRIIVIANDDSLASGRIVGSQGIPKLRLMRQLALHHARAPFADRLRKVGATVEDGAMEGLAELHL